MELQTIANNVDNGRDEVEIVMTENGTDEIQTNKVPVASIFTIQAPETESPLFVFWKLFGFFRRVLIYFVTAGFARAGFIYLHPVLKQILQCVPIITTIVFVFRQCNHYPKPWHYKYGFTVLVGMLVAILGIMILQFDKGDNVLFGVGKLIQMGAWIILSVAFGFRPLASRLLVRSIIVGSLFYYYLYHGKLGVPGTGLVSQGLALKVGGVFYVAALFMVNWRAWARVSYVDIVKGRWYEIAGAFGATFLIVHDLILFVNHFFVPPGQSYPLLGAPFTIEAAYYVSQLFIAISVVDGSNIIWPEEVAQSKLKLQRLQSAIRRPLTNFKEFVLGILDWFFV